MDGHMLMRKRRCTSSPSEPRKIIMQDSFARKYVKYLVPALTKISKESNNHEEMEKIVRHEADMALVLSAEGCAWSHALKRKLQLNAINDNVGRFPASSTHPDHANMFRNDVEDLQNTMLLKKISSNVFPNHEPRADEDPKWAKRREIGAAGTMKEVGIIESEEEKEEEEITRRLTYLRTLLPGGSEMMVDDFMLSELGSYISCLELQVNILRSMVQIN